jgi:hypothetical protein
MVVVAADAGAAVTATVKAAANPAKAAALAARIRRDPAGLICTFL